MLGVAASGTPGAEAVASGEGRGFLHSGEWWGLYAASTVLMLVCYAGILRQQLALSRGERIGVLDSLRQGLIGLPATLALVLLQIVTAPLIFFTFFAWTAQIEERLGPLAAYRRSFDLARGRLAGVAGVIGATIAAVLVFVLLTGILMAVVMNLAGQGAQTGHAGLSFSRWLMAAVLSLPVVYCGAVSVAAWRVVRPWPASPAGRA